MLIRTFAELVTPLGHALPDSYEVVLHDLRLLPDSIVAVSGDVTGRQIGDPATDLLLERAVEGDFTDQLDYRTQLPDGRCLRSSTMIIRNFSGEPIAALCINADISMWRAVERTAAMMTGSRGHADSSSAAPRARQDAAEDAGEVSGEKFARDVDELAAHLLHESIREEGIPVELMKKEHKIAVVRSLKARGIFLLRDAVELVATALHVTRFTIYNYLNEINEEDDMTSSRSAAGRASRRKGT